MHLDPLDLAVQRKLQKLETSASVQEPNVLIIQARDIPSEPFYKPWRIHGLTWIPSIYPSHVSINIAAPAGSVMGNTQYGDILTTGSLSANEAACWIDTTVGNPYCKCYFRD